MNRIAGILNLNQKPVDSSEINRMTDALKLRPQDEESICVSAEVGLGCTHIGGIAGKHLDPLLSFSPNEGCVITFDGRIHNRQELLAILGPQELTGNSQVSDAEFILAAYKKWGRECPKHLIGDFAFAIWDKRKHRLVCARDQFGVKPFYYYLYKEYFVFASTPHAVLASGKAPPVVHEERIVDLLMESGGRGLEAVDKTSSFYKDVFRLPPAHMLMVQANGMSLERYWELCPADPLEFRSEDEYLECFQELFTESIRCRVRDTSVPASMLSGGMDSSAIVSLGHRILAEDGRGPLHAFAVVSNRTTKNRETSYISSVLTQRKLQPHLISEYELSQCMDELVEAIERQAEPFDWWMNLNRAVYFTAQDRGFKALLDGVDGDLLLSDSFYIPSLWRHGAIREAIDETWRADGLTAEYRLGRRYFIESVCSAFIPEWVCHLRQRIRDFMRGSDQVASAVEDTIINVELAKRYDLEGRFAIFASYSILSSVSSQIAAHKADLDHPNLPAGLERYGRVASAFGIEARHPLMDIRLAEFCLGLPWHLKTRRGWTKYILRRAMEPYLPQEVIWRRDKDSLMWEVNRLILKERAGYFYQITSDEQANLKPYVDLRKLMNYWQEYLTRGDEKHAGLIWSGIALATWLRQQRNLLARLKSTS